jgi:signal transduction histidine kinase
MFVQQVPGRPVSESIVENGDLRPERRRQRPAIGGVDLEAPGSEGHLEHLPDPTIVLDHEDPPAASHRHDGTAPRRGPPAAAATAVQAGATPPVGARPPGAVQLARMDASPAGLDGAAIETASRGDRPMLLVFSAAGELFAADRESAAVPRRVFTIGDLAARFRTPDGTAPDLTKPGSWTLAAMESGSLVSVTVQPIERLEAEDGPSLLAVSIWPAGAGPAGEGVEQILASVLAHELRTPLTTIYGGAQLMIDPKVHAATRLEAAASVAREAQHLHRTVEDLLELVRPDPDREVEPTLLQRSIPGIVASERAMRPGVTISMTVPPELPPVMAREDMLAQVIGNLVGHAVAYSPPDRPVVVACSQADAVVELRVTDDGPGRDEDASAAAFDLFHQSARTVADRSGANLSLAVTRRLVERMGGRIWASARATGGEVTMALPVAHETE